MPRISRLKIVDTVKGVAIVLVVYGHVAQGVQHRGWWGSPYYFFQERFIYSFHMAAFFFVAGLFLQRSISKSTPGQFVTQRLRTVLWPYLFCALSAGADRIFRGGTSIGTNSAAGPRDLVHTVLIPAMTGDASWFLPTLFLCLLLALATDLLPTGVRFALALGMGLFWPANLGGLVIARVAEYFVFLVAGEWMGPRIERIESVPRWTALAGSCVMFALVALGNVTSASAARSMVTLLGFGGILGLFLLAAGLRATAFETASAWCGIASLGIFVLHPFFQGAMRFILARMTSSHNILLNVLVPTVVAVIGPGLCWHFRQQLRIGFLFEFPWGSPKPVVGPENSGTIHPSVGRSRSTNLESATEGFGNRVDGQLPTNSEL